MNKISKNSLINGVPGDCLNINDRSIHYGDGLFETILCSENSLYYWSQHYQRLQTSAQRLKLDCPSQQILLDDISRLLDKNKQTDDYVIKIIISRGAGERGYKFSKSTKLNRLVLLSALNKEYSSLLSMNLLSGDLFLCKQQVSINETLAGLKHLNRLENVMASNEFNADYIDGLMLNANQHVIEGTMSNLFAVRDNKLFTPELNLSGVNGIMREIVIELACKNNMKISIENLSVDDLYTMDELFISNSLLGVKSVNKLCDRVYDEKVIAGKIFNDLLNTREMYAQAI